MLNIERLIPTVIDNQFKGNKLALWFFYLLTAVTVWRSQHHLFAADGGAQSIATIPLDTYSQEASNTIVGIFALWGLSQLIIGLLYVLACVRYRSLIPMFYLLGIIEYAARAFYVGQYKVIETVNTPPGEMINIPLIIIFTIMLILSLWQRKSETS